MKHLYFIEELSKSGKTKILYVHNFSEDYLVGKISWKGSWRQYVWEQSENTIMSIDCLQEIILKLQELKNERSI